MIYLKKLKFKKEYSLYWRHDCRQANSQKCQNDYIHAKYGYTKKIKANIQ